MTKKTIKLITGAVNVVIAQSSDEETTITFNAPPWGLHKKCMHKLTGRWEIQHINRHLVTLINHNQII
ncbi:MAG: hypothetical protein Q7U47_01405 [Paludibacter sp.]|nr:hypothetical protein [Paludibacter sp.]